MLGHEPKRCAEAMKAAAAASAASTARCLVVSQAEATGPVGTKAGDTKEASPDNAKDKIQ